jgi:hypothetical protein
MEVFRPMHRILAEHGQQLAEIRAGVARIETALQFSISKEFQMAHTLDEAVTAAQAASSKGDSVLATFATVEKQLADALAGVTIPADAQAKIDAIFDIDTATAAKLGTAIATTPTGAPAP